LGEPDRSGKVCCPAHDDDHPSLGFGEDAEGNVWVKCYSQGCSTADICKGMGIEVRELFLGGDRTKPGSRTSGTGRTGAAGGNKKQATSPYTPSVNGGGDPEGGSRTGGTGRTGAAGEQKAKTRVPRGKKNQEDEYWYLDAEGKELYQVLKFRYEDGHKDFKQRFRAPNKWWVWGLTTGWYVCQGRDWTWVKGQDRPKVAAVSSERLADGGAEGGSSESGTPGRLPLTPSVNGGGVPEDGPDTGRMPVPPRTVPPSERTPKPVDGAEWFEAPRTVLFRLPEVLAQAAIGGEVWVCEGEKDVKALEAAGLVATCNVQGAGKWRERFSASLVGCSLVHVVRDRDGAAKKWAGEKHAKQVLESLTEAGVPWRLVEAREGKDAADHLELGFTVADFVEVDPDDAPWADAGASLLPPAGGAGVDQGGKEPFFWCTDLGNAERFVHDHGADLRYCAAFGQWLSWDGRRWLLDETEGAPVLQRARTTVRRMRESDNELVAKFAPKCEGADKLRSMMSLAKGLDGIPVVPGDLDRPKELLPVRNGVLDLRTGELREHRREDLITKFIDVDYNPKAKCPTWTQFLKYAVPDDQLRRWLWKWFGYCLTGLTKEQCLVFFYGEGKTGKSTCVETMTALFGDYAKGLDPNKLMIRRNEDSVPEHFARLKGARLVAAVEVKEGDRFDEGLLKRLTGGDRITTRKMRENSFEFDPDFKLMLTGNNKPFIRGMDQGIWRRMKLIPFEQEVKDDIYDGDLKPKMLAESEGLLAWAVAGCTKWYSEGLGSCSVIDESVKEYREESDTFGHFVEENVVFDISSVVGGRELFDAYAKWAKRGNEYIPSETAFPKKIERAIVAIGGVRHRFNSTRGWKSIRLVSEGGQGQL
jgi:putative DNA primase/helicase